MQSAQTHEPVNIGGVVYTIVVAEVVVMDIVGVIAEVGAIEAMEVVPAVAGALVVGPLNVVETKLVVAGPVEAPPGLVDAVVVVAPVVVECIQNSSRCRIKSISKLMHASNWLKSMIFMASSLSALLFLPIVISKSRNRTGFCLILSNTTRSSLPRVRDTFVTESLATIKLSKRASANAFSFTSVDLEELEPPYITPT